MLDPAGGALGKMLPAFRMGLGGPVGSGEQGFPWIGIDELLDVYAWVLQKKDMKGPVNAVHPGQISQKVFSNILAGLLSRPSFMPLPAGVVRALFGEMGQETLLADLNIQPAVLLESGFDFRHSMLADCLGHLLGNQSANDKAEA